MTCMPAHLKKITEGIIQPEHHVWRRSLSSILFGTMPLMKCECGRRCWMDRADRRYAWNVFPPINSLRNS